jgi:hypothetical protein
VHFAGLRTEERVFEEANQELNGYTDPDKVPEYRVTNAGATGVFNAGYAFPNVTRPPPALVLDEEHRWAAETVRLTEPVSAYESHLKSKGRTLTYLWDANMIVYYQSRFMPGHALLTASQEVTRRASRRVCEASGAEQRCSFRRR